MFKLNILFLVSLILCNAQKRPSISYITQKQIKDVGGSVELKCSVQSAQEYTVLWVKTLSRRGQSAYLSTGSSLVIRDSRFELRYEPSSSTYTLRIKDVKESDTGIYQCQIVVSANDKILADVELVVQQPSNNCTGRDISQLPKERIERLGSIVELKCSVHCAQDNAVLWVKMSREQNHAELLSVGSSLVIEDSRFAVLNNRSSSTYTLKIRNIQKADVGTYHCQLILSANNRISASVDLKVEECYWHTTPTIRTISGKQTRDIGDTVELQCSVKCMHNNIVLWVKNPSDSIYLSNNKSLIIKDPRFAVRYEQSVSSFILQIKDIQESDAATYQCQVILSKGNIISADVDLKVRSPPHISNIFPQSTLVASEGDSVRMECYADGYPQPKVTWTRKSNTSLVTSGDDVHTGPILKISSVQKADIGTYYCVADNGVGNSDRRTIHLEVVFAPNITVSRPSLGQALQHDTDLACHIEAYPLPFISWMKDGIRLENNQHHHISHAITNEQSIDSTLRITTIEKSQYGDYICFAQNKLGQAEGKVFLFETVNPV